MRILMIHNRYGPTARGGAERVVEHLMAALAGRGHQVDVHDRTTVGFHALSRLPVPLRACWHVMDLVNIIAALRLRATLRRTKPDIIHTHNLVGCGGLTAWVIRRSRIPWVHTLHDVQCITPSGVLVRDRPATAIERSFLGAWFRVLRRWSMGSPTVVTAPSRWLLELHSQYGCFQHSATAVIGNPVDLMVREGVNRMSGRTLGKVRAVRRFTFVGQVEGVKGIVILLESFRGLRAMFPDVTLQIVGEGSLFPALKRAARDTRGLVLRGRLPGDGVRAALDESDILVVPSLCAENQPSAILEAYAAGVPVVASRVGGIPEIVRDGETGFLVDPGSVDDLLRALRLCVEDPQRVRAMAPACRAVAEEHAVERIVREYEEVYEHIRLVAPINN